MVLVFPFFIWVLLWKKITVLKNPDSVVKFGSTYNELRTDSRSALLYNVFYMFRRLLIAIVAALFKEYSFAQV